MTSKEENSVDRKWRVNKLVSMVVRRKTRYFQALVQTDAGQDLIFIRATVCKELHPQLVVDFYADRLVGSGEFMNEIIEFESKEEVTQKQFEKAKVAATIAFKTKMAKSSLAQPSKPKASSAASVVEQNLSRTHPAKAVPAEAVPTEAIRRKSRKAVA